MNHMSRILIVDDDHETCRLIAELVNAPGRELHEAHDAESAMALARREPFNLVISDINLNGPESGLDVLKAIRSDAALRFTPVILYSADDDPAEIAEAKRLGAQDYLVKGGTPFDVVRATVTRYAHA